MQDNGLDSKIVPKEFKWKIIVFLATPSKKQTPNVLTSGQIIYQIFSFFDSKMTQDRTPCLTDQLNFELYNVKDIDKQS